MLPYSVRIISDISQCVKQESENNHLKVGVPSICGTGDKILRIAFSWENMLFASWLFSVQQLKSLNSDFFLSSFQELFRKS